MPENEYRNKIKAILKDVTDKTFEKKEVSATYTSIKKDGIPIKDGITNIFKIEEAFDVPKYITENTDEELTETGVFKIKPPSSYPEADKYWSELLPYLKRIGVVNTFVGEKPGEILVDVNSDDGSHEKLTICLVRDSKNSDKPSIILYYKDKNTITPEEAIRFLEKPGIKVNTETIKNMNGYILVDAFI